MLNRLIPAARSACAALAAALFMLAALAALGAPAFAAPTASVNTQSAQAPAALPSVARPGPGDPSCARPVYPQPSLRNGEQGKVVLSYLIGLDGAVLEGKVVRSSGFPELDRAAYVALAKCLYRMPDGATTPRWMPATFVWSTN